MAERNVRGEGRGATGFRFKIDAYTPDTMPLDRLANYMLELSKILGEPKSVHLIEVEDGCTAPRFLIDREDVPKVRANLELVRNDSGSPESMASYRTVNKMLRDDAAIGRFEEVGISAESATILYFPGREEQLAKEMTVRQHTTVDGELVRIGGLDKSKHAQLQVDGKTLSRLNMDRATAKQLGGHLYEYVRLSGEGQWTRDPYGTWTLKQLEVQTFQVLKWEPLNVAIKDLRESTFNPEGGNLYDEMTRLRHGNGGDDVRH